MSSPGRGSISCWSRSRRGPTCCASYLADLRGGGPVEPLSSRLARQIGWPEWALLEHVRVLAAAEAKNSPARLAEAARRAYNRTAKEP